MFIPSALLGFIIGMSIWLLNLVLIRLYSSARKSCNSNVAKENQNTDFDLKLKIPALGEEELWKKIR